MPQTADRLSRDLTALVDSLGGNGVDGPAARKAMAVADQVGLADPELAAAYTEEFRSLYGVATVLVADKERAGEIVLLALARVYVERASEPEHADCAERLHAAVFAESRRPIDPS